MPESQPPSPGGVAGTIHDIGYQRYEGARLGRRHGVWALYVHSLRAAFGLGRRARAKIMPFGIAGLGLAVAAILVLLASMSDGKAPLTYLGYLDNTSMLTVLFVAVVAPELVSRDIGNRTLPLYFARPITRVDYALAKFAAMASATMVLLGGPLLVLYLGLTSVGGLDRAWRDADNVLAALASALLLSIVMAAFALLLASLSGRRAFAAGAVVGVYLLGTALVGTLDVVGQLDLAGLFAPATLVSGTQSWLFGEGWEVGSLGPWYAVATAALLALCGGLYVNRYRKVAA